MADYISTGFTDWQLESLKALLSKALLSNRPLPALPAAPTSDLPADLPSAPTLSPPTSAPPSVLQLCTSAAPSEPPHQQLIPAPVPAPVSAQRCPPPPSVETIEEVEHPLRDIRPMNKKLGASKTPRISRLPFDEICIGWPTKFGGSNMLFSRDENPDAWYTTMLNTHAKAQQIRATNPFPA